MIDDAALHAIVKGQHTDPFSVLGPHADPRGRWWVRAMLPGALEVAVVADDGTATTLLRRHPDGLFEGMWRGGGAGQRYRLRVRWHHNPHGEPQLLADAYTYGALLDDATLDQLARGEHPRPYEVLGAHLLTLDGVDGVRFALWAPNARRVSVVGDFNQWDGRRHVMRLRHRAGVWEIFVPHAAEGDRYKFELLDAQGSLLPLKADPYAFEAELRPANASRVVPLPSVRGLPPERVAANARSAPVAIYEVHAASWRRRDDGGMLDWDGLALQLVPYASALGFTHLELLPITEYPFDPSWGYQTLGLFAPTARHGSAQGFVRFVQACQQRGLGLLLDWVPAHFPVDAFGLGRFDGTALYEYGDPREGYHQDWNTYIYNFGRNEVRNFLAGSARFWAERYGIDGLRVDAVASMLYRDYSRASDAWVPNAYGGRENLEAISLLRHINEQLGRDQPGCVTIAEESTAFPGVSRPTSTGGLGFHYKWNMGWMHDTLQYMQEEPVHRKWHHDKMRFGLLYAFDENFVLPLSHDEVVHGKGSLLGKMPGDDWQRFANLRAYYGFMWGHPGKKLLFMGQEFAQHDEWSHESGLPWHLLQDERHTGVQRLVRDLNGLYRGQTALHALDCESQGFEWLVHDDADSSVFAWLRRDGHGNAVLVVCNFTPVVRPDYQLGVPAEISGWREVLNTDSSHYGGSNQGNGTSRLAVQTGRLHGRDRVLTLRLPPLATLFLVPA